MHSEHHERVDQLETSDSHEARDLTHGNIDRRAGHKTGHSGDRDEFHYPAKAEETDAEGNEPTYKRYTCGNFRVGPFVWVLFINIFDYLRDRKRHDRNRADGNIL